MDWKSLFLSAQGRIGQRDFWLGFLAIFVANIVLGLIPILGQLISLLLIYPSVCIFSQRLHDFGKTGWLAALPWVVTIVGFGLMFVVGGAGLMGAMMGDTGAAMGAAGALGAAGLIGLLIVVFQIGFLLWVGLTRGDAGANAYGLPRGSLVTVF